MQFFRTLGSTDKTPLTSVVLGVADMSKSRHHKPKINLFSNSVFNSNLTKRTNNNVISSHKDQSARTRTYKKARTYTCMDTHSQTHLLLLLTLLLCLLPFLSFSCTAPDKQHQKQHSHQPQRKHPFTCSGIYLLTPLHLCVCVPLSHRPSPYPTPQLLHLCLFFLSVRLVGCG